MSVFFVHVAMFDCFHLMWYFLYVNVGIRITWVRWNMTAEPSGIYLKFVQDNPRLTAFSMAVVL